MEKETYISVKGKWVKATKWILFKRRIKWWFIKWKLVDTFKYRLIPQSEMGKWFGLSDKEYEDAEKLYKEKGTISYEFYPCAGIGWGVRIHVLKTDEIIDISDVSTW